MSLNMLGVATCPTDNTAVAAQTSIAFTPDQGPGELYKALSIFTQKGIQISKIESRQLEKHSTSIHGFGKGSNTYFKNVYFIEFEASVMEPRVQYALERLQELASYVRILGCYPMDAATC